MQGCSVSRGFRCLDARQISGRYTSNHQIDTRRAASSGERFVQIKWQIRNGRIYAASRHPWDAVPSLASRHVHDSLGDRRRSRASHFLDPWTHVCIRAGQYERAISRFRQTRCRYRRTRQITTHSLYSLAITTIDRVTRIHVEPIDDNRCLPFAHSITIYNQLLWCAWP